MRCLVLFYFFFFFIFIFFFFFFKSALDVLNVDVGRTLVIRKPSSSEVWQTQRVCVFGPSDHVFVFGTIAIVSVRDILEIFDMRTLGWGALEKPPLITLGFAQKKKTRSASLGKNSSLKKKGLNRSQSVGFAGSMLEMGMDFQGSFFCLFEGCVYSVGLSFQSLSSLVSSSSRELPPHSVLPWCTSGTVTCLSFSGTLGFTGHSSGTVTSWVVATGEIVRLFNAHPNGVASILPIQDKLFSAGLLDALVKQSKSSEGQEFRSWRTEMVMFSQIRMVGPFLGLTSRLSLWFMDLSSSEPTISIVLLCKRRILDWKWESGSNCLWVHVLTEDGLVSSFSMPGSNVTSLSLPEVRMIPDFKLELGLDLRSGSFLLGQKLALLVLAVDGRVIRLELQRPSTVLMIDDGSDAHPAIVRVQARIRQRLVISAISKNKLSVRTLLTLPTKRQRKIVES